MVGAQCEGVSSYDLSFVLTLRAGLEELGIDEWNR